MFFPHNTCIVLMTLLQEYNPNAAENLYNDFSKNGTKIAVALRIRPHLLFYAESDDDAGEKIPRSRKSTMTDAAKDELIKRLNDAIRRIVKRVN